MRYILSIFAIFILFGANAQNLPERGLLREGNRLFNKGEYKTAVEKYTEAKGIDSSRFEILYNLGNALYKADEFESAEHALMPIAADSLLSNVDRSESFFNLGNAQFKQQKYKEALESYKNAIRLNHLDQEAKYNYAYTKRLLEQQENQDQNQDQQNQDQNQDQQNQDQQNQDQDKNQDQNKDKQDNQDQNQSQDQQDQGKDDGEENQDQGNPQPQEGKISEQEQKQMLDAIQAQEDKTQDKLKEKAKGVVVRGSKNW